MKHKTFDTWSIVLVAGLVLLAAILMYAEYNNWLSSTPSMEEKKFFDSVEELDNKLGVDYRNERIDGLLIKRNLIPDVREAYEKFAESIPKTESNSKYHEFIRLRLMQIEAEEEYTKSSSLMRFSLKNYKKNPVYCDRKEDAYESLNHLEKTYKIGIDWINAMDALLQKNPGFRNYVGVNRQKPMFYIYDYRLLIDIINEYRYAYSRLCA